MNDASTATHTYTLVHAGRDLRQFKALCSCGWLSEVFPSAGLAGSAHTTHREEIGR